MASMDPPPVLSAGDKVGGRYLVERMLGYGGMGQVFEVEHEAIGRHFALKLLNLNPCTDEILKRFQREARALGLVTTPRVAQVTDFGYEPGLGPFYVMELLDGETLEDRLERDRRLPVQEVLSLGIELAEALQEVHDAGIIHRDLKPSNVGLCRAGAVRVKLLDFGLAAATDDAMFERITRSQEVVGSLPYMAPERFNNAQPTTAVDLYALGVLLYEALVGKLPCDGASAAGVINAHLNTEPPPMSEVAPEQDIPPSVEAVVARLLDKDPSQRFESAAAAARALQGAWMDAPTATLVDTSNAEVSATVLAPDLGDGSRTIEDPRPPEPFTAPGPLVGGGSATELAPDDQGVPPRYLTSGAVSQPTTPASAAPLPATVFEESSSVSTAAPTMRRASAPTAVAPAGQALATGGAMQSPAPPVVSEASTPAGQEGWTTGQTVPPTSMPAALAARPARGTHRTLVIVAIAAAALFVISLGAVIGAVVGARDDPDEGGGQGTGPVVPAVVTPHVAQPPATEPAVMTPPPVPPPPIPVPSVGQTPDAGAATTANDGGVAEGDAAEAAPEPPRQRPRERPRGADRGEPRRPPPVPLLAPPRPPPPPPPPPWDGQLIER